MGSEYRSIKRPKLFKRQKKNGVYSQSSKMTLHQNWNGGTELKPW